MNSERHDRPQTKRPPLLQLAAAILFAAGLAALFTAGRNLNAINEVTAVPGQAERALILASTVQLELFVREAGQDGELGLMTTRGLGTVVQINGRRFIMTHNHWPIAHIEVECVFLKDGAGELLLALDRKAYLALIRYQDEGTLLLDVPQALFTLPPAELGDSGRLLPGDRVFVTARSGGPQAHVSVKGATVRPNGAIDMPGSVRLQGSKTVVAPGDSGGGVWHNGKLVGNVWARINNIQGAPWTWLSGDGDTPKEFPSGLFLAAELPASVSQATPVGRAPTAELLP